MALIETSIAVYNISAIIQYKVQRNSIVKRRKKHTVWAILPNSGGFTSTAVEAALRAYWSTNPRGEKQNTRRNEKTSNRP